MEDATPATRPVTDAELRAALDHVRLSQTGPNSWVARSEDFRTFNAQGRSADECMTNARLIMQGFLSVLPESQLPAFLRRAV